MKPLGTNKPSPIPYNTIPRATEYTQRLLEGLVIPYLHLLPTTASDPLVLEYPTHHTPSMIRNLWYRFALANPQFGTFRIEVRSSRHSPVYTVTIRRKDAAAFSKLAASAFAPSASASRERGRDVAAILLDRPQAPTPTESTHSLPPDQDAAFDRIRTEIEAQEAADAVAESKACSIDPDESALLDALDEVQTSPDCPNSDNKEDTQ